MSEKNGESLQKGKQQGEEQGALESRGPMTLTLTCPECSSAIDIRPTKGAEKALCEVCGQEVALTFKEEHFKGVLKDCPCCQRKDFYKQRDFNRKIGVFLFIVAAIASIWTYGLSLVALWLIDFFLFQKLPSVAICYNCQTVFRNIVNIDAIYDFNHEMNDRIIYDGHNFNGEQLEEH